MLPQKNSAISREGKIKENKVLSYWVKHFFFLEYNLSNRLIKFFFCIIFYWIFVVKCKKNHNVVLIFNRYIFAMLNRFWIYFPANKNASYVSQVTILFDTRHLSFAQIALRQSHQDVQKHTILIQLTSSPINIYGKSAEKLSFRTPKSTSMYSSSLWPDAHSNYQNDATNHPRIFTVTAWP